MSKCCFKACYSANKSGELNIPALKNTESTCLNNCIETPPKATKPLKDSTKYYRRHNLSVLNGS